MDIIIRDMKVSDIDYILDIEKEVFTTPWSRKAFEMEILDNQLAKYVVAQIDGRIVGYGGIWLIIDEGHITNIAVSKEYQGKGIGNKLVEALIKLCQDRDIYSITLEVRKSNIIAQNLYAKYGFENCGIRPNYYSDDNEDAVIMWRNIR